MERRRSGNQNDFAVGAGGEDGLVGFDGFGEGKFFADDRTQAAVFQASVDGGVDGAEFGGRGVEKHEAVDGGFAGHGVARGDFDFAAAADDDDAAVGRENAKVFAEVDVGKHFEDDVGAAAVGEAGEFFEVGRGAMVEDFVSALFARGFAAFVGPPAAANAGPLHFS